METVFSVPTSISVTESGVPSTIHIDVNIGSVQSASSKYSHPTSLGIDCSDHASDVLSDLAPSLSLTNIAPGNSSDHRLLRFTDDLGLCIKHSPDVSPLADDDEDVRSLLAAAAAVAAADSRVQQGSATVRSSSGLNTPPDSRGGRLMDTITCRPMSVGVIDQTQAIHSTNSVPMLVSRHNLTGTPYVNNGDPLTILLQTSTTQSMPASYVLSSSVPTPCSSPLTFRSHSPIRTPHLDSRHVSAMLHHSLSCKSHPIENQRTNASFPSLSHLHSPDTPPSHMDSYTNCKNKNNQVFDTNLLILENTIHSPCESLSPPQLLSGCNSSSRVSGPPCLPVSEHNASIVLSPGNVSTDFNACTSMSMNNMSDNVPHNWKNTAPCDTDIQVKTCKLLDSSLDSVSKATDENLMDLEQVISSHSASLPAVDDEYFLKTSDDFHVETVVNIDLGCIPHPDKIHSVSSSTPTSPKISVVCSAEPDFPEIYADISEGNGTTNSVILPHEPSNGDQPTITLSSNKKHASVMTSSESADNFKCKVENRDNDCLISTCLMNASESHNNGSECKTTSDSPPVQTVATGELWETESLPVIDTSGIPKSPIKDVTHANLSDEDQEVLFKAQHPDDILEEDSGEPNDHSSVHSSCKDDEVYNDAEYAAAAVAAVDDVVYALAGNRKPDPSLTLDPALEGTGTDRLYNLSLAPAHGELNNSQTNVSNTTNFVTTNTNSDHLLTLPSGNNQDSNRFHQSVVVNESSDGEVGSDHLSRSLLSVTPNNWNKSDLKGEFLCLTCHKVFPQKALLLKHRIMHEEPKHMCDTCGRSFVREDKLKRHVMSIHTTEKPHVCHICSKAFSRKDKLKDHLKHHDRAARNFECQQCQQPFVQKSDLNRHIRGVHQGEPGVGINMTVKRKAPGSAPPRLPKRRSKPTSDSTELNNNEVKLVASFENTTNSIIHRSHNGKSIGCKWKSDEPESETLMNNNQVTSVTSGTTVFTPVSVAAASVVTASTVNFTPLSVTISPAGVTQAGHPIFAANASGLMFPTMTAAAHHHLVQQQAAATVMLPNVSVASMATMHPSAISLQQQQQQFFAMAAMPALAQSIAASQSSNGVQQNAQHQQGTNAQPPQASIHFQPELKAVATPSGPMMVLTHIATTNQSNQAHPLTGQTIFPQVVGFHATAAQQQQLQQLQQQAAVVQHQQLLQQQQANYAAAVAAAGTHLVAVSGQGHGSCNQTATNQAQQFQLHHQATQQLQQQQHAVALAAHQQAAHNFLFNPSNHGGTVAAATGTPTTFFCHPQEGMTAGLILASSTDPASFALAAAQAQVAAAAAAQQRQQNSVNTANNQNTSAIAATQLQVITNYSPADAQQTVAHQQLQHQQLLLQQQHQQRLAAMAAAAGVSQAAAIANPHTGVLVSSNTGTVINGTSASVIVNSTQEEQLARVQHSAHFLMGQQEGTAAAVSNYRLAAFTNAAAAAALYQQQHPGFMLAAAAANAGASNQGPGAVSQGSATAAAITLQQQQQQQQYQQQAGLMAAAAYHHQQQQQVAHHQALQQQQQIQAALQQQ